jgi:hypothetical protein
LHQRRYRIGVLLPLVLLAIAAISAAIVAYGINPAWMQFPHGLEIILASRRFEWPLIALTLVTCVALIALIVAGKKRAWWLLGLAPIVTLLGHRLAINPSDAFQVNAQPMFVSADHAPFMAADDWVVGLIDGPDAVAYPYASLYSRPLVVRTDEAEPTLLMWSPFANCATAFRIDRSIRPNELEVVAMPGNALLAYNSRIGQFINGVTGLTPAGDTPAGFVAAIPIVKTTWTRWIAAHPATIVMTPPLNSGSAPSRPVLPYFPMPHDSQMIAPDVTIALIRQPFKMLPHPSSPFAALDSDIGPGPVNFSNPAIVITRNPITNAILAFARNVDEDLTPTFKAKQFRKVPSATMVDSDSGSAWTPEGRAVDGPLKGKRLREIDMEDLVYFRVARLWFPALKNDPAALLKPAS